MTVIPRNIWLMRNKRQIRFVHLFKTITEIDYILFINYKVYIYISILYIDYIYIVKNS